MSKDSQQDEFDLIGNILSEEDKTEDYSPDSKLGKDNNISPVNKKNIKL